MDLVVERVAGAAGAGPERAAALDHEVLDHAVEDQAVVEGLGALGAGAGVGPRRGALGEADEVRHRLRGVVRQELDPDVTCGRVEGCEHGHHLPTRPAPDPSGAMSRGVAGVVAEWAETHRIRTFVPSDDDPGEHA
ncbi:Uncharacterised protein [Mycobacteroides abscessus]|nr:Uncharacterised protein [Mycobacteroides abscessus]